MERQYSNDLSSDGMELNDALKRSLRCWRGLIECALPREISLHTPKKADVAIFTNGFTPDHRKSESGPDRVGAVMFDRSGDSPKQLTAVIPKEISRKWMPRKTQIVRLR